MYDPLSRILLFLILSNSVYILDSSGKHGKHGKQFRESDELFSSNALVKMKENDTIPASLLDWDYIESSKRFSILSMALEHHVDGTNWYIPSLHEKYSAGWNRTVQSGYLRRPHACGIRLYGMALEKTLKGFIEGGTGYITLQFKAENGKFYSYGFDKSETNKLHCYYMTNKNYGSEFIDTPKTLGLAVYCPVSLDEEIGEFAFRKVIFCFICSEITFVFVNIYLSPAFMNEDDDSRELLPCVGGVRRQCSIASAT